MKFDVHAVINWVFFTIIVCPDSLISEMSRIAKCECIQCLLILQHSLPSERTFCVTVVKWGIFRRKKKHSVPFHPSFPSKLRCLLSPKGSLNSSTTLFRVKPVTAVVFPCSLSLRAFCLEQCLPPSDRNYIVMT